MILFGIIASIVLLIGIIILICGIVNLKHKIDKNLFELRHLNEENDFLKHQVENPPDEKIGEEKVKTFENRIFDLNQRIEDKQGQLQTLENQKIELDQYIEDLKKQHGTLSLAYSLIDKSAKQEQEKKIELLQEQNSLNEAIQASKTATEQLSQDIKILEDEVSELKERKRLSILNQNDLDEGLWEFSITGKEKELISILERIKIDYPELKNDISSIEGRKIGLSKAQDMANEHGLAVSGIYRLILKSDETVCYVGQAVNIKDRGYQHIKKMIGVDVKGNEKLYDYRPEDFYWTVIEFEPKNLNDSEHYGIDYFGCKEKGLNRKA